MFGLPVVSEFPPSTPSSLVYGVIWTFLMHCAYDVHAWECRNGYRDSSEYCGVADFFSQFPQAQERLKIALADDILRQPAYRFWFLLKAGSPIMCLETVGTVWMKDGTVINLVDLHPKRQGMWEVVLEFAWDYLPGL